MFSLKVFALSLLALCTLTVNVVRAQVIDGYPTQPIKLVVPFPPGGASDIIARVVGQKLAEQMKATVIIENKAGANGNIAAEYVVRAKPDGYTLIYNSSSVALSPALYKNLSFDVQKDLAPVILTTIVPMLLSVNTSIPVTNLKEFTALLKAKPDSLSYGSAGVGNITHLAPFLLLQELGLVANHVPYKGSGPASVGLVGGEIQFDMQPITVGLAYAKEGRVRPIAVSTLVRSPALPDVPTLDESGLKGFELGAWQAIMVPAKTPPAIIKRLNADIMAVIMNAEVKERLLSQGAQVLGSTPEEYGAYLASEIKRWDAVVKSSKTEPQ
jgi:tripartite-type tricarboxylate transporter receptor subunit TctC